MEKEKITVASFSGSLRKGSYNTMLLKYIQKVSPPYINFEIIDISQIPLYNEDVRIQGEPSPVKIFKEKLGLADALIIATPEYNYSFSGVTKNAIDWASRPLDTSPLNEKPVAFVSVGGRFGGSRAVYHLHQVAIFTNMYPLNKPELLISNGAESFDENGNPIDSKIEERVLKLLDALYEWTFRLKKK
ncbi:NADPH-dependent FMN reductase [Melioribacteraceae bacterium 4301-Me]|uniref:NADPH-dependent FMN reductase n=1 Tax=Pyranulibacter aquaticus TaxID=3163344 RepID=UPI00359964E1